MTVGVLGPVEVDGNSARLGARDRVVLATLVLGRGALRSPEELADAIWGEAPPASWAKNVQGCVSRLRKTLGRDAIVTSPYGYRLVLPPESVDAWQFESLVSRVRELATLGERERARYVADQALALWRGRPLSELEEWPPAREESARLLELKLDVEELRLDAALQAGHHREVLAEAQSMVQAAPLRERRWSLLALAQYRAGRQAEALRTLHQLRRIMSQELGLDPAQDAVMLEEAILRQDPSLVVEAAVPMGVSSPYLGLTPYEEADAEWFFGRSAETAHCLRLLSERGVLAVVGPSGSGKSSLVRAGVAAALGREGRAVVVGSPSRRPMDLLDARGNACAVVVVDQAEELFTVCDDPEERERFVRALAEHAEQAPVVVALRADAMGEVAAHPALGAVVEGGLFLLGGMTEEGLRQVIERPAEQSGLVVEPGLTDLLVREVEGEPGALPLLSHTLRETWLRREGRTLTVSGYRASGGVREAVAQTAERLYAETPEPDRDLFRELLMRLVAPGPEGRPTRAAMPRRSVVTQPAQEQLVARLVAARLMTSDQQSVQIAHESLVQAWPRLRGWLDDDVEGRRILHHLVSAADAWESLGRPASELYRGVRLTRALAWRDAHRPELTAVERDFLAAAEAAAAAEERSAVERARQQAAMIRRLRVTLTGAAVLLAISLVAGFLAVRQADRAEAAAVAESARRLGARALVTEEPSQALLLAVAGIRLDDSVDTRSSLLGTLARFPYLVDSMPMEGDAEVDRVALHPTNGTVATYDQLHRVRLYDLESGELLAEHQAGQARPEWNWQGRIAFSPDGEVLAVTTALTTRSPVQLLDATTLVPLPRQPGGLPVRPWQSVDLGYAADGSHLVVLAGRVDAAGQDTPAAARVAAVWRLAEPARPRLLSVPETTSSVALSPDGATVYANEPLSSIDVDSGGRSLIRLEGTPLRGGLALRRDGSLLAVAQGADGGQVALVDPRSFREVGRLLPDDPDAVFAPEFTPDGRRLVTVTFPQRVTRVWDVATQTQRDEVDQEDGPDAAFAVAADGDALYSASSNGQTLRGFDLTGRRHLLRQVHEGRAIQSGYADVSPDGRRVTLAGGHPDGLGERRWFLDLESGDVVGPFDNRGYTVSAGSWSPDSEVYVTVVGGVLRVWDPATGEVLRRAHPSGDEVTSVDHSVDGSMLVLSELDGRVTLLDGRTLEPAARPVRLDTGVGQASLGPDNRTAIALAGVPDETPGAYFDLPRTWAVVDLVERRVVHEGDIGFSAVYGAMSPDGRHAAVSGYNGDVLVLDVASGRPVREPTRAAPGGVFILKFSADGRRMVASSTEGFVSLWDVGTGLPEASVPVPGRPFVSAVLVDEETVLASAWQGEAAWRWDTGIEPALDLACRAAGRDLTTEEWRDSVGDLPYQDVCPGDG